MRTATFKLKQHWLTKQWRWQVRAINNKIIGDSTESYFNKGGCIQNAINLGIALNNAPMKHEQQCINSSFFCTYF